MQPAKLVISDPSTIARAVVSALDARRSLVDVLGGMPISIAAMGRSAIASAYRPVSAPQSFAIADVEAAAKSGAVTLGESQDVIQLGKAAVEQLKSGGAVRGGKLTADGPKVLELKMADAAPPADIPPPPSRAPPAALTREDMKVRAGSANFDADDKIEREHIDRSGYRTRAQPAFAAVISWKQIWRLQGYSRGRLLNSLTLAPQEETVIELFSWDRRKRQFDQSQQT